MPSHESLRDVELRLNASMAEAERWLPALLELPAVVLLQELEARPELCTAGMMQRLLDVAADALEGSPHRAHELTSKERGARQFTPRGLEHEMLFPIPHPPKTHTVDQGGVKHAPGSDNPTQKCAICHGKDLRGGKVAKVSCYECHERKSK